jgi:hypothetical protein
VTEEVLDVVHVIDDAVPAVRIKPSVVLALVLVPVEMIHLSVVPAVHIAASGGSSHDVPLPPVPTVLISHL